MWKKWAVLIAFPVVFSACAGSHPSGKAGHSRHYRVDRYSVPKSDVPLVVNDKVVAWVDYFTGPGRERFGRYVKRSGRYAPMIRQTLKSYGLPQDILYLAMIESGFASKAKSHASAVGVWQFIRSTGNRYGLDQDIWIEERQDAEKATHAAAKYLKDLYGEFGNWYLAFAAYNSGEGTVRRAIARYGSRDFWELSEPNKGAFRAETRDYVPKYIAAAIIAKNPDQFGFHHVQPDAPIAYETVTVDSHVDIDVIAKCAGVDTETIDIMNSELKLGTAPPHYRVKLPPGTGKKFQLALARIAPEDRVKFTTTYEKHTVGKREGLYAIAKRFGVKPGSILAANGLRNARAVRRGMTLTIPVGDVKSTLLAQAGYRKGSSTPGFYIVRRGDSIKGLAERFDVSTEDLRDWNNLNGRHAGLKVGSQVRIQSPDETTPIIASSAASALAGKAAPSMPSESQKLPAKKPQSIAVVDSGPVATGYVVSTGDSWNSIAQTLGVSTKELKVLNPGVASAGLRVGDILLISTPPIRVANATPVAGNNPSDDSTTDTSAPEPVVVGDVPLGSVKRVNVEKMEVESTVNRPATRMPTRSPKAAFYKVRPGDSLDKIAKSHGVTVGELQSWNQLTKASHIRPGQKLIMAPPVQAKVLPGKRTKETQRGPKVVTYKVKPGDNLWIIGKRHKISPSQMKQLSQVNKGSLRPGDVITLRVGS